MTIENTSVNITDSDIDTPAFVRIAKLYAPKENPTGNPKKKMPPMESVRCDPMALRAASQNLANCV
jgi:hypothetical protein